jgi:hypothetical protein
MAIRNPNVHKGKPSKWGTVHCQARVARGFTGLWRTAKGIQGTGDASQDAKEFLGFTGLCCWELATSKPKHDLTKAKGKTESPWFFILSETQSLSTAFPNQFDAHVDSRVDQPHGSSIIIALGDPEDLPPRSDQLISSGWEVASLPGEIHICIYVYICSSMCICV